MAATVRIWPVDAVNGVPKATGRDWRLILSGLVSGNTAARPFGAISGVWPGSAVNVTATSSTWTVPIHGGVLDLEQSTVAGPYFYKFEVPQTGAMAPAHASLWRTDSLFVTMEDQAESDGTPVTTPPDAFVTPVTGTPGPQNVTTRGTAGGPPAVPARSMELAQITVPPAGQGNPTVKVVAPFTVANGGILPLASSLYLPPSPYVGQPVYDRATDRFEIRDSAGNWAIYSATHYCEVAADPTDPIALVKGTQRVHSRSSWDPTGAGAAVTQIGTLITYDGNGGLVVHRSGKYEWGCTVVLNGGATPTTEVETAININGVTYATGSDRRSTNASHLRNLSTGGPVGLSNGDVITLVNTSYDVNTGVWPRVFWLRWIG